MPQLLAEHSTTQTICESARTLIHTVFKRYGLYEDVVVVAAQFNTAMQLSAHYKQGSMKSDVGGTKHLMKSRAASSCRLK